MRKAVEPLPATERTFKVWGLQIDPAKATETIYWAGEGVEALPKWFPEVGREMATGGGEIIDVLAILAGGAGFYDAMKKRDRVALVGFSLTLGAAAIDLASALTGDPTLAKVAVAVKFSKTGWTLFAPSKKELAALQFASGTVPQRPR